MWAIVWMGWNSQDERLVPIPLIFMADLMARHSSLIVGKHLKATDVVIMALFGTPLPHRAAANSLTPVVPTAQ